MSTEPVGREHRRRGEVLAGDQLQRGVLALDLAVDQREQLVVTIGRPGHAVDCTEARETEDVGRWKVGGRPQAPGERT